MSARARAGPGINWDHGAQSQSPMWLAGTQKPDQSSSTSKGVHLPGAGIGGRVET